VQFGWGKTMIFGLAFVLAGAGAVFTLR
jgi:hypothetical protein